MSTDDDPTGIVYQHSVLCQTFLPYRDPGTDVGTWQRSNGFLNLKVVAGDAMDPATGQFVPVGLPFGPKARLVLYHLNAEALRTRSPVIELAASLTKFVRHTLALSNDAPLLTAIGNDQDLEQLFGVIQGEDRCQLLAKERFSVVDRK